MWSTSSNPARTDLDNDYKFTWLRHSQAKEKVQPPTSHDAQYWTSAAAVCEALAKHLHAKVKLTIWYWIHDENEGDYEDEHEKAKVYGPWWSTFEARRVIEHIQATTLEKELYIRQAERITRGGPIPRVLEAIFTTSQIGICVDELDMKCRQKSEEARFKDNLIEFYDTAIDPVTGFRIGEGLLEGVHLFPYSLGPESLFALFGEDVKDELMTARKGLLFGPCVEVALNLGVITLVPDIPDEPTMKQVAAWQEEEPKNYKWRIIDEDAEEYLAGYLGDFRETKSRRIRDLDGKRLFFHNENRPHPRYLFFLSAVAQLKMVWRHQYQYRNDPDNKKLKLRLGKGFWLTAGKYLNRAFLRALAKQIGHDDSTDEECNGVT